MPVSAFAQEAWKSNEYAHKPQKKLIVDTSFTPKKKDGVNIKDNFDLYGHPKYAVTSKKRSLQPLLPEEKVGPRWNSRSNSVQMGEGLLPSIL